MALSADEAKTIEFYVEPIAKAVVEKKLDYLPTLKQKLINKLLELRHNMSENTVKILVDNAISNITGSLMEQESSAQIRNTVNEIIRRINMMF
ncbi:MAG: hypothetical protein FD159_2171 [Syntrophaceae bacterium]|nr:MAG: hypothetical protein FD159_2171 [Syntrophaceae bacterium]